MFDVSLYYLSSLLTICEVGVLGKPKTCWLYKPRATESKDDPEVFNTLKMSIGSHLDFR